MVFFCGVSLLGVRTFFRNFFWQKVVILVKRRQIKKLPIFLTYMGTLVICTKLKTSFDPLPLPQFWLYVPAVCIFLCFASVFFLFVKLNLQSLTKLWRQGSLKFTLKWKNNFLNLFCCKFLKGVSSVKKIKDFWIILNW